MTRTEELEKLYGDLILGVHHNTLTKAEQEYLTVLLENQLQCELASVEFGNE